MRNWNIRDLNIGVANGAEIDLAISEEFSKNDLVSFLRNFADEKEEIGGNILTGKLLANTCLHVLVILTQALISNYVILSYN